MDKKYLKPISQTFPEELSYEMIDLNIRQQGRIPAAGGFPHMACIDPTDKSIATKKKRFQVYNASTDAFFSEYQLNICEILGTHPDGKDVLLYAYNINYSTHTITMVFFEDTKRTLALGDDGEDSLKTDLKNLKDAIKLKAADFGFPITIIEIWESHDLEKVLEEF